MGLSLSKRGYKIKTVISRNTISGAALAQTLNTDFTTSFNAVSQADLVFICVNDDQIEKVVEQLPPTSALVCHSAGSISMNVLDKFSRCGVFYPLQSIAPHQAKLPEACPILIEAKMAADLSLLEGLVKSIGYQATALNSEQRLIYHLAAVFVNNFTNAMLTAASDITEQHKLDYALLQPLIQVTLQRMDNLQPAINQTGPARRGDQSTMQRHIKLLKDDKEMLAVYESISKLIARKFYH